MTFEEWWSAQSADMKIDNAKYAAECAWEAGFKQCRELINTTGYVLVPVEPTEAMVEEGEIAYVHGGTIDAVYKAMIKAAQEEE